jgi:hypothetical protein
VDEYKRTGKWRAYLPLTFYYPLLSYSLECGPVSRHINKSISDLGDQFLIKDEFIHLAMRDRIRLMNDHGTLYNNNNVKINMVHSYYGYNPNSDHGKLYRAAMKLNRFLYKVIKTGRTGR